MSTAIRLSTSLIEKAQAQAAINLRTTPKQIEYWALLGRIAEENPDLPLDFIKETLIGLDEIANNQTSPFTFRK